MGFEKNKSPVLPEKKVEVKEPWFFRRVFSKNKDTTRKEALKWDKDKQDAEKLLQDLPSTKKAEAREATEKWKEVDPKKVASLLSKVPPEKKMIIESAKSYIGTNEKTSPGKIAEFHTSAGQDWCGSDTAWCMSFVQHILKKTHNPNYKPTAWAKDGLSLWKPTDKPQIGDLLIVERWEGWHIGFLLWFSDSGNPIIIWGNQGNGEVSVKEETRPILWYRNIA